MLAVLSLAACGGDDKNKGTTTTPQPSPQPNSVSATPDQLRALAQEVGHDVYWAGAKRGYTYELTRTKDGNIYIRYLPAGVPVGAGSADFLSVGTYPQADAFETIRQARDRPGETVRRLRRPKGAVAVIGVDRPNSVYFAYPGSKLLIEVYDPKSGRALRQVAAGRVEPVR